MGPRRQLIPELVFAHDDMIDEKFKIFSGTANPRLADEICGHLGVARGKTVLGKFSDGEIYFQILGKCARRRRVRRAALHAAGGFSSDGIADDD